MIKHNEADLLTQAFRIAVEAHAGQTDKLGEPYMLHPVRVMLMGETSEERIVGLLHDVVEDCADWPLNRLSAIFPPQIVEAIDALTRRRGESYADFIARVKSNPLATAVKLYDIRDNTAPERIWLLDPGTRERLIAKYEPALRMLGAPLGPTTAARP
jgi:hypothetical protein